MSFSKFFAMPMALLVILSACSLEKRSGAVSQPLTQDLNAIQVLRPEGVEAVLQAVRTHEGMKKYLADPSQDHHYGERKLSGAEIRFTYVDSEDSASLKVDSILRKSSEPMRNFVFLESIESKDVEEKKSDKGSKNEEPKNGEPEIEDTKIEFNGDEIALLSDGSVVQRISEGIIKSENAKLQTLAGEHAYFLDKVKVRLKLDFSEKGKKVKALSALIVVSIYAPLNENFETQYTPYVKSVELDSDSKKSLIKALGL